MRDFPDTGRGGRLLVAELTRDSVSVCSQCELEADSVASLPPLARETGAGHAVVFVRR